MFLGLDFGTGSVKALILSASSEVVAEASVAYEVTSPHPGWAETHPDAWWQAVCDAVDQLEPKHKDAVQAIGFSGQMHGAVMCEENGTPLRPAILWADTRSAVQLRSYQTLSDEQRRCLGNPIVVGMTGPSLLWLKENEPEIYNEARWALQPKDWVRFKLTGHANAEPSDASATLLYDLEKDSWSKEVVEQLGLRFDLLAPLIKSSQIAGQLTNEAARDLGLAPGIPVAAGGGDAACSAFGSGLVEQGQAQINIGTAMQIFAIRKTPTVDPNLRTHLYRTVQDDYYAMAAMQNAGIALEWVRRTLSMSWDDMYAEAFSVPAGSEGLLFLPYLTGERTPHLDPNATGTWHGMTLKHGRGHLARAAFEGVVFALKDGLKALIDTGINPESLRLAGGGTARQEWQQLLADVLEKPLYAVSVPSASAKGAALLASLVVESSSPPIAPEPKLITVPNANEQLLDAYGQFRNLYPALKGKTQGKTQ